MLSITIPATELWDEVNEQFVYVKERTIQLEHSLVSISKWESKWKKPFLSQKQLTYEEAIDYIKCMTITQNVDPNVYYSLSPNLIDQIDKYMGTSMTATTFREDGSDKSNHEIVTAELIYYWMIALNIPLECQKWHFTRLLTLIRVCSIKNAPPKKQSKRSIMSRNAAWNAERRRKFNSKG
ncbi:MAG: hypothetical protein NC215_00195 [Ruminococcus sp.]|nr:hypothetical protein [Ruminococcus sp.]